MNWVKRLILESFGKVSKLTERVRVWLVALARTKLAKENEPEENP